MLHQIRRFISYPASSLVMTSNAWSYRTRYKVTTMSR
ncbi:hypothetical protein POX_c04476 [Penicillium oxalicum]|nr:hypothetical protein POX_c04476 [Penicillium oxalicum]KAI2791610.1 hypothetical protein POX_c04476 [Penicillium oxalicum]